MCPDQLPEIDIIDLKGTTDSYSGTVGTSYTAVPASPGNKLSSFTVICEQDQVLTNMLSVSLDGGTTTIAKISPGGVLSGDLSDSKTQIHIKGNVAGVAYQVILKRETF